MTALLFATDLHGNERSYEQLWALAAERAPTAVVLGGDLFPWPRGPDLLKGQRAFVQGPFAAGLRALRERAPELRVFAIPGNDDWAACVPDLEALEQESLLELLHLTARPLSLETSDHEAGPWIAGYACVPITPFKMSDWDRLDVPGWEPEKVNERPYLSDTGQVREGTIAEVRARPTIEADLAHLATLSPPARTVYVTHSPPYETNLDRMHGQRPIGSHALRAFVEAHQPPLTLHGHVHESPRLTGEISDQLGRTLCVNPGDSRQRLRAAWVELEDVVGTLERLNG